MIKMLRNKKRERVKNMFPPPTSAAALWRQCKGVHTWLFRSSDNNSCGIVD
jgi:hypothetical protein